MKKGIFWVGCVMIFSLLVGCAADTVVPKDTAENNATVTQSTEPGTTVQTHPTEPVDIRPQPPENPGSSLIAYDPDRKIYISTENIYMDYYEGVTRLPSFTFLIFSKEYLDPETISVTFPIDLPFWVDIGYLNEIQRKTSAMLGEDFTVVSGGHFVMPYYVYQAYRGTDFASLRQIQEQGGSIQDEPPQITAARERDARMREDFKSLRETDLPEFYVYSVCVAFINISNIQELVTLEKLDVHIGEEVYEAKLGRVRLFPKDQFPSQIPIEKLRGSTGNYHLLYNDGIVMLHSAFAMENIREDMILTGLRMAEEESEILEIIVTVKNNYGVMETIWDGESPIYLCQGDSFIVDVVINNKLTSGILSRVFCHTILEYQNGKNEKACAVSSQVKGTGWNFYEYYAIIFDGIDMEPYYRDYLCATPENT